MIRWKSEDWAVIEKYQLLREIEPSGSANCSDCSRRYEVEYICDRSGNATGYINCEDCGLEHVSTDRLRRWQIDTTAMFQALFGDLNLAMDEQVPNCLWKIGRANWAGYSRYVWFVRSFSIRYRDAVEILKKNPKAIVFAPMKDGSDRWRDATGSLLIPLEGITSFETGKLVIDVEEIEGLIDDAGLGSSEKKIRPIRKRAEMTAKIELLTNAVIEFIQSARDYAFLTLRTVGAPELLPRPTQKKLGESVGLKPYEVSKCFKNASSRELRMLWNMALNIDMIMKYDKRFRRRRKT
ncbi:hypothetical protein AB1L30_04765 [Bremerella sp. JC817]|uniref:hypothetical protein n=1 Tax=Bremerella sp. JC817 TaxID=3231756 RepID=UPI003457778A